MKMKRAPQIILSLWLLATLLWWALAFLPVPDSSPEWLSVARNVCFGSMENGLPSAAGWMILTLGPLSFLLFFLVAWPGELMRTLHGAFSSSGGRHFLYLAFAVVLLEAVWVGQKIKAAVETGKVDFQTHTNEDFPENYPRQNKPAPDFELVDQSGKTVSLQTLKGENVILTFAFAHCQTVCPVLVRETMEAMKSVKNVPVRLLIVTLDPWRDTPSSLPFLAEKWNLPMGAHVLSGKVETVNSVLSDFNVPRERDEKTGDVIHPALVYLISADGRIAYTFNNAPAKWLSQAVERITHGKNHTAAR